MKESLHPLLFRSLCAVLGTMLLLLQLRLWVSEDGFTEMNRLKSQVSLQTRENSELAERNGRLTAEVGDLKKGFGALEERARSDLGLISPNETFFVFGADATDSGD